MKNPIRSFFTLPLAVFLIALTLPTRAADASAQDNALADQVYTLFKAKCFECHTPTAKKWKKFNNIDNLAAMGASKYVVSKNPDKSDLYLTVKKDEMPPEESGIDPCTPAEKETLKSWIAAGCPVGTTKPLPSTNATVAAVPPKELPIIKRASFFVGKFHPLVAHFPIALLTAAAIAECLYFIRYRSPVLTGAVRFCTVFGAMGAVGAAALGWFNAYFHSSSDLVDNHRWLGTGAAILAIPIAIACEKGARRAETLQIPWAGASRWFFRVLLVIGVALTSFAAHIGGAIVYGIDYFNF